MTLPKAEGTRSKSILKGVEQQLSANQQNFFNVALLLFGNDAKSAMEMLKPMAENNNRALRIVTLMRAGQYAMAEDEWMDYQREIGAQRQLPPQSTNGVKK